MGNEAYDLQGRNGVALVGAGAVFVGRSAGLLVLEDSAISWDSLGPSGATVAVTLAAAPAGLFPGGTVTSLSVTTGQVFVYPLDTAYTIS